jgi:hypothetical protein
MHIQQWQQMATHRVLSTLKTDAKAGLADSISPLPSAAGGVGSSSNRNLGPAELMGCRLSAHMLVTQHLTMFGIFGQGGPPIFV